MKTIKTLLAPSLGFVAVLGFLAGGPPGQAQGSLLPPGPPAPSMKTLEQIEPRRLISALPYTITAAGSYYLTTNLSGSVAQDGIIVQADNVTLDLNGFALLGAIGSSNGITCATSGQNLTVRNGTICHWGTHGIDFSTTVNSRFERLNVYTNGGWGIHAGNQALVEACQATGNANTGIQTGPASRVRNCLTAHNGGHGVFVGTGGNVIECTAQGNGIDGISGEAGARITGSISRQNLRHGFSGTSNLLVSACSAQGNRSRGVSLGDGAGVSGTVATTNADAGIYVGNTARVSDCTARANVGDGIRAGSSAEIADTTAGSNQGRGIVAEGGSGVKACLATGNTGVGIQLGNSARVSDCQVQGNSPGGIFVGNGSTVSECSAQNNGGDGIRVSTECLVLSNHCHGNDNVIDSAGIHATGAKNQIRDNSVTSNVRGVSLDVDGNFVARNLASNNTINYRRTPSQTMGTVLTSLDDPATSGEPWANFAF